MKFLANGSERQLLRRTFSLTILTNADVIRLFQARSCNIYTNGLGIWGAEYFAIKLFCGNYRIFCCSHLNPWVGSCSTTLPITLMLIPEMIKNTPETAVKSLNFLGAKTAHLRKERVQGSCGFLLHNKLKYSHPTTHMKYCKSIYEECRRNGDKVIQGASYCD